MSQQQRITIFGIRLVTVVLVLYWIALFTGTHMPRPPKVGLPYADKVQHFAAFFILALLLCQAIPAQRLGRKLLVVLAIAIPYAAFDEWTQGFTATRTVDINDFYANTAGILAGVSLYALIEKFRSRRQPR